MLIPIGDDDRNLYKRSVVTNFLLVANVAVFVLLQGMGSDRQGIRLLKLNCFEIRVSDPGASLEFYQGLFGMPVQARTGDRVCLRVGDGPQFMAMRQVREGEMPAITQIGYSVADFDPELFKARLVRIEGQ